MDFCYIIALVTVFFHPHPPTAMCFGVFICRLIVSHPIQFSVYLFRPCFPQSDSLVFQSGTMCSSSFKHGISSPYSAEDVRRTHREPKRGWPGSLGSCQKPASLAEVLPLTWVIFLFFICSSLERGIWLPLATSEFWASKCWLLLNLSVFWFICLLFSVFWNTPSMLSHEFIPPPWLIHNALCSYKNSTGFYFNSPLKGRQRFR